MRLFKTLYARHKQIRQNNLQAFEKLFREYYAPLCRYAYRFVNDMDTAEEIVQDFFYHYWKDRKKIRIRLSVKSYLFRSVKNNALKYLDQVAVRRRYAERIIAVASESDQETLMEQIHAKELQQIINDTLQELPERCRIIFTMNRFDGFKYHEIAQRLSISVKTVEANMSKALQVFRKKLKEYHEEHIR
jgi:RNA polymerase sigma-70 factor, ECF subfamily